jgi:chemotaxis protein histidine kinase CheA
LEARTAAAGAEAARVKAELEAAAAQKEAEEAAAAQAAAEAAEEAARVAKEAGDQAEAERLAKEAEEARAKAEQEVAEAAAAAEAAAEAEVSRKKEEAEAAAAEVAAIEAEKESARKAKEAQQKSEEEAYTQVMGALETPAFAGPVAAWVEAHCDGFDLYEQEAKLEHTTLHTGYGEMAEGAMEGALKASGVPEETFGLVAERVMGCAGDVGDSLRAMTEFDVFREMMMIAHKAKAAAKEAEEVFEVKTEPSTEAAAAEAEAMTGELLDTLLEEAVAVVTENVQNKAHPDHDSDFPLAPGPWRD